MVFRKDLNAAVENSLETFCRQVAEAVERQATRAMRAEGVEVLATFADRVIFKAGPRLFTAYLEGTSEGISVNGEEDMGLVEDDEPVVNPIYDLYRSAASAFMNGQTTLAESILRSAAADNPADLVRYAVEVVESPKQISSIKDLDKEIREEDTVLFRLDAIVEGKIPEWDLDNVAPLVIRDLDSIINKYEGLARTMYEAVANVDITELSDVSALGIHLATDLTEQVRVMQAAAQIKDVGLKAILCQSLTRQWPVYAAIGRVAQRLT